MLDNNNNNNNIEIESQPNAPEVAVLARPDERVAALGAAKHGAHERRSPRRVVHALLHSPVQPEDENQAIPYSRSSVKGTIASIYLEIKEWAEGSGVN